MVPEEATWRPAGPDPPNLEVWEAEGPEVGKSWDLRGWGSEDLMVESEGLEVWRPEGLESLGFWVWSSWIISSSSTLTFPRTSRFKFLPQ